jgi:phosphatidylserine decarboxylase
MNSDTLLQAPYPQAPATPSPATAANSAGSARLPLEPMDPQLTNIQPGGGVVIQLELAWGRLRRWYLKTFRPSYVARMRSIRRGDYNGCPHEVLDPRDLKFYRNQGGYYWDTAQDPFAWRDRLPFARVGLAELILMGGGTLLLAVLLLATSVHRTVVVDPDGTHYISTTYPLRAIAGLALAVIGGLIVWFFRNPIRVIPTEAGVVVAPADGKIVAIDEIPHDDFIGGRAVRIGIFLSIFNVHINRMPIAARVIGLTYRKGKMLNALRPESARENEQLAVRIESLDAPQRRMIVRQITGQIARRIVCWSRPGDVVAVGEQFGMIKLGSRTELVLPWETGLTIQVKMGAKVSAGSTILARYPSHPGAAGS